MKLDNVADVYPLSPMQEGMLFHTISDPGHGVYVDQVVVSLKGSLDSSRFVQSYQRVCPRFDVLRTQFVWDGVDQPLQIVRKKVEFPIELVDWTAKDEARQRAELLQLVAANKHRGFDLAAAPLLRLTLCKCGPERWLVQFCFHHIILDGWSTHKLLHSILDDYRHATSGRGEPEFRYRDYIQWLQSQDHDQALKFWQQELAGVSQPNSIGPPAANSGGSDLRRLGASLPVQVSSGLRGLAREQRLTLNTVVQALWSLVVSRYAGGDSDVVFGTTVAGRPPDLLGVESGVGLFINTVPFRTTIEPQQPLCNWLADIQSRQSRAREWDFCALADIQKQSALPGNTALFETILVFENYPSSQDSETALVIDDVEYFEESNYPLALLVVPGESIESVIVYDAERFSSACINRIFGHLQHLAEKFVEDPTQEVGQLLDVPLDQRSQLAAWNETSPRSARQIDDDSMDDLIWRVGQQNPDQLAIIDGRSRFTYSELLQRADHVAEMLAGHGVGSGEIVGLCAERSTEMIIGILGIMRAGAAYLPLDTIYPQEHFRYVLGDARVNVVLAQRALENALPDGEFRAVFLEDVPTSAQVNCSPGTEPNDTERLAYVIYTSGSTGQPKGVMISHRNLVQSTRARSSVYASHPHRFLLLSSFAFDSSVAGIFWTLSTGGTLVLPREGVEQDADAMGRLIEREQVTHTLALPQLYQAILESLDASQLESLQTAIVAGEAMTADIAKQHYAKLSHARLFNEYGPTEATVWATAHQIVVEDVTGAIPIGRPIPGAGVLLLDPNGHPVPVGCVGEIHITGPGIAVGYLNQADQTKRAFVEREDYAGRLQRTYRSGDLAYYREDGCLVFCGRADRQVKVRGYRIEPSAVEAELRSLSEVADAAVTVQYRGTSNAAALVAYVELRDTVLAREIWTPHLRGRLPDFMIPDQFVCLEALPRLPNGKVDTGSLPEPNASPNGEPVVSPRTSAEQALLEIWTEVLGDHVQGVHQSFFAVGGDSISSIRIISRARRAGLHLEPRQITEFPTIAELAAVVRSEASEIAEEEPHGEVPLSPIQCWFFAAEFAQPNHWNQSQLFQLSPEYDSTVLFRALEFVIGNHPMLHARFRLGEDHRWYQTIEQSPPKLEIERIEVNSSDESAFQQSCWEFQASLNIRTGPLYRLAHFVNRSENDRILFVLHHLVVDAVSWQILMDDIEFAYHQISHGEALQVDSSGSSYATWCRRLLRDANSQNILDQLPYWQSVLGGLPGQNDASDQEPTEGSIQKIVRTFDVSTTSMLRFDAHQAYNTRVHDLLLAATVLAISEHTGCCEVLLNVEGFGRSYVDELDVSRCVGWFTNLCPIRFKTYPGRIAETIKSVKEEFRGIPQDGIGFGILKYLNLETARSIKAASRPKILFNYLGVETPANSNAILRRMPGALATSRARDNTREHAIEINAVIRESLLSVEFAFAPQITQPETIEQLAEGLVTQVHAVLDHCCGRQSGYTPSDFPESGLSQSELDEFLEGFD